MTKPAEPRDPLRGLTALLDWLVRIPRWLRVLVPITGMLVLWWSSSKVPDGEPHSTARSLFHNTMHVVAYACIAASLWVAWSQRPVAAVVAFRSRGSWLLASLYGVVDELHQAYVPGRMCSFADLVSDASGAALAVVVLRGVSGVAPSWRRIAGVLVAASLFSVAAATFANW
ncbi:MAG: VanZ family protein [Planctomycetota bacterium]